MKDSVTREKNKRTWGQKLPKTPILPSEFVLVSWMSARLAIFYASTTDASKALKANPIPEIKE
jgi:hypothetical protein